MERARAVNPAFALDDEAEADAVTDICAQLDGIALAIELAAARMVSMTATEVRDRLADRFRLLAGGRRAAARHRTLHDTVAWSYELLTDEERMVLQRCAVFADGFDLAAMAQVCADIGLDDYALLDALDSLVRKSLVGAERVGDHTRYGMLETIRQFADEQLTAAGAADDVRDRHARWFADRAVEYWNCIDGSEQGGALDWLEAELANLRAGYRWARERDDLPTAAAIAAHAAMLGWLRLRFEPVGWAEELLEVDGVEDLAQLPRLYTAAGMTMFTGDAEAALGRARAAIRINAQPGRDPFDPAWSHLFEAGGLLYGGHFEESLELYAAMAAESGLMRLIGLFGLLHGLPAGGRAEEAAALADEALEYAVACGSAFFVPAMLMGRGRTFAESDPARALADLRTGLALAREQRLPFWETRIAREAAGLEALHGDVGQALELFDVTLDSLRQAGDRATLAITLANLAVLLARLGRHQGSAVLYGAAATYPSIVMVISLPAVVERLRGVLGGPAFDAAVAAGAAMDMTETIEYVREQIRLASRGDAVRRGVNDDTGQT